METKFINHVIMITLGLAGLGFSILALTHGGTANLGILAGALWGCVNLILIKHLIHNLLTIGCRNNWKRYILLWIKFPLLYVAGYALLKSTYFSIESIVVGFSLLSLGLVLKGLKVTLDVKSG